MTKKPFSLTYVTYEEGDVLGFLAAGVTLAPIFLMVMYASLIIFRREFHTMAMLVGQVRVFRRVCSFFNDLRLPATVVERDQQRRAKGNQRARLARARPATGR